MATSAGNATSSTSSTGLVDNASISSVTVTGPVTFSASSRIILPKRSVGSLANGYNIRNIGTNLITEISGPTAAFTNVSFTTEVNTEGDMRFVRYNGSQSLGHCQ